MLLAKNQEIFYKIKPITIKYKHSVGAFRFMSSVIIEVPEPFLQESFVAIARFWHSYKDAAIKVVIEVFLFEDLALKY
jgi:hypothetical protein